MNAPFFSVIVPVCNRVACVKSGVEMLLSQTFRDFEAILVDDGSSDGSAAACDEAAAHEKITTVHTDNAGAGPARNAGLGLARGKYVCFFDIDDRVGPDWLEKIYGILKDETADLLVYGYRETDSASGSVAEFAFDNCRFDTNVALRQAYPELLSGVRFNNGFVWNKVYDREFLSRNAIRFPDLRIQQDEVFNHAVYKKAERTIVVPWVLYDYYVYNSGTGRSAFIPGRLGIFKAVRASFLDLYGFWGLDDKRLLTYIHRRFIHSILYNRNKTGLRHCCRYAGEVFSSAEAAESLAYLKACCTPCYAEIDRLYRIAVERKSKTLFLLAEIRTRTVQSAKCLYRRLRKRASA